MAEIVVEIAHLVGSRRELRKFYGDIVRVGRGYQNDLILNDPYVSSQHIILRAEKDGWVVEDLNSKNGAFKNHTKVIVHAPLQSGDEITIGKTHLYIFYPEHPVEPAKPMLAAASVGMGITSFWGILTVVVLMMLVYMMEGYLGSAEKGSLGKLLLTALSPLILVLMWAGVWALVGRMIKHRSHFLLQTALGSLFFLLMIPISNIAQYLGYWTSSHMVDIVCSSLLGALLSSVLLSQNLALATYIPPFKRKVVSAVICVSVILIGTLVYFTFKGEFNPHPDFYGTLKPPLVKFLPTKSIDQYLKKAQGVFIPSHVDKALKAERLNH